MMIARIVYQFVMFAHVRFNIRILILNKLYYLSISPNSKSLPLSVTIQISIHQFYTSISKTLLLVKILQFATLFTILNVLESITATLHLYVKNQAHILIISY